MAWHSRGGVVEFLDKITLVEDRVVELVALGRPEDVVVPIPHSFESGSGVFGEADW